MNTVNFDPKRLRCRARVVCQDGATVSIQAGGTHYCTPRDYDGPYTAVEAGFPSVAPPASWNDYKEQTGRYDTDTVEWIAEPDRFDTVYGYLPVEHVVEFINAHGGYVRGETPPMAIRGLIMTFKPLDEGGSTLNPGPSASPAAPVCFKRIKTGYLVRRLIRLRKKGAKNK